MQEPGESVDDFAKRLIALHAKLESISEEEMTGQLLSGLKPSLKAGTRYLTTRPFQEALDGCRRAEMDEYQDKILRQNAHLKNSAKPHQSSSRFSPNTPQTPKPPNNNTVPTPSSSAKPFRTPIICHYCKREGHKESECYTKKRDLERANQQNGSSTPAKGSTGSKSAKPV